MMKQPIKGPNMVPAATLLEFQHHRVLTPHEASGLAENSNCRYSPRQSWCAAVATISVLQLNNTSEFQAGTAL